MNVLLVWHIMAIFEIVQLYSSELIFNKNMTLNDHDRNNMT